MTEAVEYCGHAMGGCDGGGSALKPQQLEGFFSANGDVDLQSELAVLLGTKTNTLASEIAKLDVEATSRP